MRRCAELTLHAPSPMEPPTVQVLDEAVLRTAANLRRFVRGLQRPRTTDAAWLQGARERCHDLSECFAHLKERAGEASQARFHEIREALLRSSSELSGCPTVQRLRQMSASLSRHYEDLVAHMGDQVALAKAAEELRPIRLIRPWRTLTHVGLGVLTFVLYQFVVDRGTGLAILGALVTAAATLEVSRRFSTRWNDFLVDRVFGLISRPRERYKTNSASFYALGLLLSTWLAPKEAVLAAVLILAFADPCASLFGARWGRRKLYQDKSLVGSAVFLATGFLLAFAYLALAGAASVPASLGIAAVMIAAGTVAELLGGHVDDNLSIPIACALTGAIFL